MKGYSTLSISSTSPPVECHARHTLFFWRGESYPSAENSQQILNSADRG